MEENSHRPKGRLRNLPSRLHRYSSPLKERRNPHAITYLLYTYILLTRISFLHVYPALHVYPFTRISCLHKKLPPKAFPPARDEQWTSCLPEPNNEPCDHQRRSNNLALADLPIDWAPSTPARADTPLAESRAYLYRSSTIVPSTIPCRTLQKYKPNGSVAIIIKLQRACR